MYVFRSIWLQDMSVIIKQIFDDVDIALAIAWIIVLACGYTVFEVDNYNSKMNEASRPSNCAIARLQRRGHNHNDAYECGWHIKMKRSQCKSL
jgi:hypothetical protein